MVRNFTPLPSQNTGTNIPIILQKFIFSSYNKNQVLALCQLTGH